MTIRLFNYILCSVCIRRLVLENEGWERDLSVTEPAEPSYD
ncbi:hypothetical protein [Methylocystis hirsuta]|nr:hypothetical protein [Methylocystis hirsuta]